MSALTVRHLPTARFGTGSLAAAAVYRKDGASNVVRRFENVIVFGVSSARLSRRPGQTRTRPCPTVVLRFDVSNRVISFTCKYITYVSARLVDAHEHTITA